MSDLITKASALEVLVVPASYACAALAAAGPPAASRPWRSAYLGAGFALAAALGAALALAVGGPGVANPLPLPGIGASAFSVRLDFLTVAMLLLVTFVGGVILRFSHRYLDGDPARTRYLRWLLATLAAVTLLVCVDNLLLLAAAWIASSLALHRLLVLYPERAAAQLAARKKFIASRAADLALLCAIGLLGIGGGTLQLDALAQGAYVGAPTATAAALLLVVAVALKSAQLPFHGWLIQVMEAPTPVSALLHAGVVNIGGFVLIRLAPLMAAVPAAQTALVAWGTATVAIASLVMTTRVSIKVMLAWSTCAQMGFMLLECGLGAYSIALLHLIGHSLYKAHAFLTSGSAPARWAACRQTHAPAPVPGGRWVLAALASVMAVTSLAFAVGVPLRADPASDVLSAILCIALASLFGAALQGLGWRVASALGAGALALAGTYLVWHELVGPALPDGSASAPQLLIAAGGFGAACLAYAALRLRPRSRFAATLQPLLFAGLYLDELFTRMTLLLWPAGAAAEARPDACEAPGPLTHDTPAEAAP